MAVNDFQNAFSIHEVLTILTGMKLFPVCLFAFAYPDKESSD
jgi:hypothetical protein